MRVWLLETMNDLRTKVGFLKFKKKFEAMYGELPSPRAKKKLKSTRHYLVNKDEIQAWHFYKQLEKEYSIYNLLNKKGE